MGIFETSTFCEFLDRFTITQDTCNDVKDKLFLKGLWLIDTEAIDPLTCIHRIEAWTNHFGIVSRVCIYFDEKGRRWMKQTFPKGVNTRFYFSHEYRMGKLEVTGLDNVMRCLQYLRRTQNFKEDLKIRLEQILHSAEFA